MLTGVKKMMDDMDFRLHDLETITDGFSEEHRVGSGGYGVVYRGVYKGKEIAIKKLHPLQGLDDNGFINELCILNSVRHQNVITLIGYCYELRKKIVTYNGEPTFAAVMERILCFEFMQGGTLDKHITDDSCDLDWPTCYEIIRGTCEGIHHLHTAYGKPIFHLDLKPANILLDKNNKPKIADLGLSKLVASTQTQNTETVKGTKGYMPPEYVRGSGTVSNKFDVFSLGVIIINVMDGNMGPTRYYEMRSDKQFIDHVCGNWNKKLQEVPGHPSHQTENLRVKKCVKIALRCVVEDRNQRPSIKEVVGELEKLETKIQKKYSLPSNQPKGVLAQNNENGILDAHPRQLRFPCFEANKLISCPLRLCNNTDNDVAFRFLPKVPDNYRDGLSLLKGIVRQRSTHTYLVWLQKQPPVNLGDFDVTLESCLAHKDIEDVDDNFLPDVLEQTGNKVYQVTLMAAIRDPVEKRMTFEPIQPAGFTKVLCRLGTDHRGHLTEIDVHPTKPWILASYYLGGIIIWNFETQERVTTLRTLSGIDCFRSTKFIAREKWFLAGDWYGSIHVRSCVKNVEVKRFKAHDSVVISLAVHPSEPLLLSSGGDERIKLWNWEANWECIRTLRAHTQHVEKVIFNPMDSNVFASTGLDGTVKIWRISSPLPITTLDCHQQNQLCVDYFHPRGDQQYMVTGSSSGNARIWDLKTNTCVRQINGLQSGNSRNVGALDCFPDRQLLVTNIEGNLISVYNFSTDGYENTVDFKLGDVLNFTYVKRIKSVAIGFSGGIAMMEIN